MEEPTAPRNTARIVGIVAVIGILVIVLAAYAVSNHKGTVATTKTTSAASPSSQTASNTTATYKDGTYTATGSYDSPGGEEQVGVQLTVKSGTVTDANLTEYADSTARSYQDMFASGYKALVVGKKLDDINLSVVSGSSLTSMGFNSAVSSIKSEAKA